MNLTENEQDVIIDNLKEYLLVLEFNDSKKNDEIISLNNRISQLENEVNLFDFRNTEQVIFIDEVNSRIKINTPIL